MTQLDPNDLPRLASELGLQRAYELDPRAFAAALAKAQSLSKRIPRPASVSDEPPHVLQLVDHVVTARETGRP
jgi:hypothetical protein